MLGHMNCFIILYGISIEFHVRVSTKQNNDYSSIPHQGLPSRDTVNRHIVQKTLTECPPRFSSPLIWKDLIARRQSKIIGISPSLCVHVKGLTWEVSNKLSDQLKTLMVNSIQVEGVNLKGHRYTMYIDTVSFFKIQTRCRNLRYILVHNSEETVPPTLQFTKVERCVRMNFGNFNTNMRLKSCWSSLFNS
ncbi:unnamed protein product [Allacma fusca]|uniref:Uncharacterized protein n=1 Tax=Allacma fusca TaxID=39272 RepID=A0A8J2PHT6_9HEXA|nr:unnamed protein product [Allacma fusca]